MSLGATSTLLAARRVRLVECLPWLIALGVFFAFRSYLSFATSALVMAMAVLSLDLLVGFAGIISLGHTIFFGTGAYVAGLLALNGVHDAVAGALGAGVAAGALAAIIGPLILRLTGLPFIMITLAVNIVFYEAANKATWLTGGDDGLSGITVAPLFGIFRWSLYGETGYFYALGWLFLSFLIVRRLVRSPFGMALQGIRENKRRMILIGTPVLGHLVRAYVVSAIIVGIAGAVSAQTTNFVGLEVLDFTTSIQMMVMLVLGGLGRLYGGLVGAAVYMLVHHFAAEWNPFHWMFVIAALLILVVRFARGGILGLLDSVLKTKG